MSMRLCLCLCLCVCVHRLCVYVSTGYVSMCPQAMCLCVHRLWVWPWAHRGTQAMDMECTGYGQAIHRLCVQHYLYPYVAHRLWLSQAMCMGGTGYLSHLYGLYAQDLPGCLCVYVRVYVYVSMCLCVLYYLSLIFMLCYAQVIPSRPTDSPIAGYGYRHGYERIGEPGYS